MEKISSFLKDHKQTINRLLPIILILYFVGVFLPNISGSIGLSVLNSGLIKIVWRVSFALLFGIYVAVSFISNSLSLRKPLLILISLVFLILLVSPIVNLSYLSNTQSLYNGNVQNLYSINTGFINILSYLGNGVFFTFFLVVGLFIVFPEILKESKKSLLLLYFFVLIMVVISLLSFWIDKELYLNILHLDFSSIYSEKGIASVFPSKNTFGLFLFTGLCCSFFLLKLNNNSTFVKVLLVLSCVLFTLIVMCTFCKSCIFASLFFYISELISSAYLNKSKKPKTFIIVLTLIFALLLFFILVLAVPSFHNAGILKYFYTLVTGASGSMVGRLSLVELFFNEFGGYHTVFGYGPYLQNTVFSWVNTMGGAVSLDNLHNSFLMVLGNGGILYLFLYIFLIVYSIRICSRVKNKPQRCALISIMAGILLYSFFESNILFISGSSGTFIFSFLLASYALSESNLNESAKEKVVEVNV